jgi:hypothetical protein
MAKGTSLYETMHFHGNQVRTFTFVTKVCSKYLLFKK